MDPLNLQKTVESLQATLNSQQQQIAALEAKIAEDANSIADKLLGQIMPEVRGIRESVDSLILTTSNAVDEVVNVVSRIDGASVTVKLGDVLK
jgi:hypothetical protein